MPVKKFTRNVSQVKVHVPSKKKIKAQNMFYMPMFKLNLFLVTSG